MTAFVTTTTPGVTDHDEFVDAAGQIRAGWQEFGAFVGGRGTEDLDRMRDVVRSLVDNTGITGGEDDGVPAHWPLDGLPLLVSAADWDVLEAGVVQRSRLLDAVLSDLYGERRVISAGILPPQLVFGHPGFIRSAWGTESPGRYQLFMLGCDVSRAADGRFAVNADRTQAPSGAGYALADRRVVARALPELYERVAPRPVSPFAQALRLALIDAAPAAAEDPFVVVFSPGIHSQTAFDQAYLATVLGFPLVEGADLVVRDGALWMRSLGSLTRVDVVLRRVDADYTDPLDLRPDSRLGVAGLVEVIRRGAVTVVNTLGSGILESPGVQRFLPDLARHLLGEKPMLPTPQRYWAGIDAERSHLLARIPSLLIASASGGKPILGQTLSSAQRTELAARIEAQPWQWVGQELPEFSSAPTDGGSAAGVGMRLLTVSQPSGYTAMVGGLGYVVDPGPDAFLLKTVAAKDVWVRQSERSRADQNPVTMPVELPRGSEFASSPRVLSDLFWIGRYAERTEGLARLLIVTRERYHEYHYRQQLPASECVPVLLAAARRVSGDDGPDPEDANALADGLRLMWTLTADRQHPGSLAHSVEQLGFAARAVRDQMSNDTWMILGAVERALSGQAKNAPEQGMTADDTALAAAQQQTLAGMLALSGLTAESMVHDAGWTMMDIGKRIERGLALMTLLGATLSTVRSADAERAITESALVACESALVYQRLNPGRVSVAAVARLMLFDAENPRSLIYQLNRLSRNLSALPGASGSSPAERLVEDVRNRLRRLDPDDLEELGGRGNRSALEGFAGEFHRTLSELSDVITRAQFSLPVGMQPLWGPDQLRVMP